MIKTDDIKQLPLNHNSARRLLTWTWDSAANVRAATIESALERWSQRFPGHVLTWSVDGGPLGILQAKAVVEWRTQFLVMNKAKDFTRTLARRYGYKSAVPLVESVRIRQGGNLRRTDGPIHDPVVPGQP